MTDENLHRDLVPERQKRLFSLIREHGAVRVDELCETLSVSPATIRRDLEMLEAAGGIRRVHGGAVFGGTRLEEPLFDDKTSVAGEEKQAIARQALEHIRDGETVYLDGGSTVLELAKLLRDRDDLTIVTNSLRAAAELAAHGPRLMLPGGELRRRSQTVVGAMTRFFLETIYIDVAFMGTIGMGEKGLTTTDPGEAFTKQQVMERSQRVILLADSGKVGKVSFAQAGTLDDLDVFITDAGVNKQFLKHARQRGLEIEIAETAV